MRDNQQTGQTEDDLLHQAYLTLKAGNFDDAIQKLRDFSEASEDPWIKTAVLYHEALFRLEAGNIPEARRKLDEFKRELDSFGPPPADPSEDDLPHNLAVMTLYTESRLLAAEGRNTEALAAIERLRSTYPKQLSITGYEDVRNDIDALQGMLLADTGRWPEAKLLLERAERAGAPWKGILNYYLGHCYYLLKQYDTAKEKLSHAFELDLPKSWHGQTHYVLGLVQYHLGDTISALHEMKQSLATASPEYIASTKIWDWLEFLSRSLGLHAEAEEYHVRSIQAERGRRPN